MENAVSQKPTAPAAAAEKAEKAAAKIFEDKCLFWNLNYESFNDPNKYLRIIEQINDYNPDIMVLVEAYHVIPNISNNNDISSKINLSDYTKNYVEFSKENKGGIIIYWNSKYTKIKHTTGYSIRRKNEKNASSNEIMVSNSFNRPCIGVKLQNGNKRINIIGVHLGHNMSKQFVIDSLQKLVDELEVKQDEDLIIGGDFNEFYKHNLKELNFNQINIQLKSNDIKTLKNKKTQKDESYDLIYSNLNFKSIKTTVDYIVSDHKPILINID